MLIRARGSGGGEAARELEVEAQTRTRVDLRRVSVVGRSIDFVFTKEPTKENQKEGEPSHKDKKRNKRDEGVNNA